MDRFVVGAWSWSLVLTWYIICLKLQCKLHFYIVYLPFMFCAYLTLPTYWYCMSGIKMVASVFSFIVFLIKVVLQVEPRKDLFRVQSILVLIFFFLLRFEFWNINLFINLSILHLLFSHQTSSSTYRTRQQPPLPSVIPEESVHPMNLSPGSLAENR